MKRYIARKILFILLAVALLFPAPTPARAEYQESVTPVPVIFVHGYNDSAKSWENNPFFQEIQYSYSKSISVNYGRDAYGDITSYRVYEKKMTAALKEADGGKVDIVVHSMGGLFTRWYLLQHKDDGTLEKVRKVIFLQTPNHGSHIAFSAVISDMMKNPDLYFYSDEDKKTLARYKKLYQDYTDSLQRFRGGKAKTFEEYLLKDAEGKKVIDHIVSLKDTPATAADKLPTDIAEDTTEKYRYSEAFRQYGLLMYARHAVRSKTPAYVLPYDDDTKSYPTNGIVTELVDAITRKNGSQDSAMHRLMLEWFYLPTAVTDDGKLLNTAVYANPFLKKLNEGEAAYRADRLNKKQYIPQYITMATYTKVGDAVRSAVDVGVWGLTEDERNNDLVVPVSSVRLPEFLTDRNVNLGGGVAHTDLAGKMEKMNDIVASVSDAAPGSLAGQPELYKPHFFNPLTGTDDNRITVSLKPGMNESLTNSRIVLRKDPLVKQDATYKVEISSDKAGTTRMFYAVRDKDQTWKAMQHIPMYWNDGIYRGSFEYKTSKSDTDVLVFSLDDEFRASQDFTLICSSPEEDTEEAEEAGKEDYRRPYYIKPVDYKSGEDGKFIIHRFRVFDTRTGKPVNHLNASDFTVTDNGRGIRKDLWIWPEKRTLQSGDNILLTLDYSGSMEGLPLFQSQLAAVRFMGGIDKKVNVGIFGFASNMKMLSDFSDEDYRKSSFKVYTDELQGGTRLFDAIESSAHLLSGNQGKRTMILMTDGKNSEGERSLDQAVQAAVEAKVRIYPVGLGGETDRAILDDIASRTGGQAFYTYDASKLNKLYAGVTEEADTVYAVAYPKFAADEEHDTEIRLTKKRSNTAQFTYEILNGGDKRGKKGND